MMCHAIVTMVCHQYAKNVFPQHFLYFAYATALIFILQPVWFQSLQLVKSFFITIILFYICSIYVGRSEECLC